MDTPTSPSRRPTLASKYGPPNNGLKNSNDPSVAYSERVKKRNGKMENVSIAKIEHRIKAMSKGLNVNCLILAQEVIKGVYDGIRTSEIDRLAAGFAHEKITDHPDYDVLAARIIVSNHHKETIAPFSEVMNMLYNAKQINQKFITVVEENADRIDSAIDYDRDYLFTYFGFRTFETSYGLRIKEADRETGQERSVVYERPQHMWMRVALAMHLDDLDAAIESYEWMSCMYFTHASPTLFSAGKRRQQLSSCFLIAMKEDKDSEHPDSIEGIYGTLKRIAKISKSAGGIGMHCSTIRAEGSPITSAGCASAGIIPMLKPFEATVNYVDQERKRKGAMAVYIEPWHADFEDFLAIKSNTGDETRRMRDLHLAVWMCDEFMRRVEADEIWSFMCPFYSLDLIELYGDAFDKRYREYEAMGKPYVRRQVRARDVWSKIVDSQIHTGEPYIVYKDAVNRRTNHQNLGTVRSSNLCVAPYTRILTRHGYKSIESLKDQSIDIWNGFEWSEVTVRQTGENKRLVRVSLSNGSVLDCTPEHQFYIQTAYSGDKRTDLEVFQNSKNVKKISAKELKLGDKLIKHDLPKDVREQDDEFPYAYTHGVFCGDGCEPDGGKKQCTFQSDDNGYCKRHQHFYNIGYVTHEDFAQLTESGKTRCQAETLKTPHIRLYGDKKELEKELEFYNSYDNGSARYLSLHPNIKEKFSVPHSSSKQVKLRWLEGLMDADGTVSRNNDCETLQLGSIHKNFLMSVLLLLQTLGVQGKVTLNRESRKTMLPDGKGGKKLYDCKPSYRLLISGANVATLISLGFTPKRLNLTGHIGNRDAQRFTTVLSVEEIDGAFDTYCFTEPKLGLGTFEGIVTGQCAEIVQFSDSDHTATCNLSSISLKSFVVINPDTDERTYDFETLRYVVRIVTRNLDKVIDINDYPTKEARQSNMRERPMGIGVQGLADAYVKMRMPFDSPEASKLNREIFETIYFASVEASCDLAREAAEPYPSYYINGGCPMSHGKFQFDLWRDEGRECELSGMWDWEALRAKIDKYGVRNSLSIALMPTASTSQLLGNNESFEMYTNNIYVRTTLAGSFKVVNQQLIRDLIDEGIWTEELKNKVIYLGGSIKELTEIPRRIRDLYPTAFDTSQRVIIDQAAERSPFIDQSQSLNIHMSAPTYAAVSSMHMYGWKKGLKTGQYYLRSQPAKRAAQVTVDPKLAADIERQKTEKANTEEDDNDEQDGWVCNRDEGCMACGS